jgi:hypothetical protein
MSDMSDRMIEYEEQNYDDLIDKFLDIKDIRDRWEQFVCDKFSQHITDIEPPDHYGEDR